MNAYEIYTYGGGELLAEVFNAIATTAGDSSYQRLLKLSLMFSAAWFTFACILRRNPFHIGKWFVGYYVVFQILLLPTVSIYIIERTGGTSEISASQKVDNVPLGLAVFAHLTSSIGDGLTQLLEKNFSLPDDLSYSKTGTVMASRLIAAASHFYITDSVLNNNLERFFGQCVFYDLLLQKYTMNELSNQTDLWSFVKERASPARGFVYSVPNTPSEIVTCKDGARKMDPLWQQAIHQSSLLYGKRLFPAEVNNQLKRHLESSYQYLTKLSEDGSRLMQQNLLLNALETGILRQGAHTNSTAAIESYAFSKAQQQKRSTYRTLGEMAAYWLPLMKQVFEALMYGSFCIVVLLIMFPFGATVLRNYFTSLLWIQLWAPLYAILNLMVTLYASHKSLAAITLESGSGLTLLTHSGLAQANQDMSALAGYLSLSIPFISMGLVKGMASTMTQLAQYVGGVTQSVASSTVSEATTGNIGLGNLQMNNQSAFNQSSNHVDNSARMNSGSFSYQLPGGGTATLQGSGETVIDNSAGISNLGIAINWQNSLRAAAMKQSEKSFTMGKQEQEMAQQSISSAMKNLMALDKQLSHTNANGTQWNHGLSYGQTKSISEFANFVHQYAKQHNISEDDAIKHLTTLYLEGNLRASISGGTPGIAPVRTTLSANVTTGKRGEHVSSNLDTEKTSYDNSDQSSDGKNFTQLFDAATKANKDEHFRTGDENTKRYSENTQRAFDSGLMHQKSSMKHFQEAKSYRESAQFADEFAASIQVNRNQHFSNWLQNKIGMGAAELVQHHPEQAERYAQMYVKENMFNELQQFAHQKGLGRSQDIKEDYQKSEPIYNPEKIKTEHQTQTNEIQDLANKENVSTDFNQAIDQHVVKDYKKMENKTNQHIQEIETSTKKEQQDLEEKVKNKEKMRKVTSTIDKLTH